MIQLFSKVIDTNGKLGTKIDWHDWEMVGADLRRQGNSLQ